MKDKVWQMTVTFIILDVAHRRKHSGVPHTVYFTYILQRDIKNSLESGEAKKAEGCWVKVGYIHPLTNGLCFYWKFFFLSFFYVLLREWEQVCTTK